MSNVAVRVESLGKRYRIGTAAAPYRTVREALVDAAKAPLRNLRRIRGLGSRDAGEGDDALWALRDVSFEVRHGEVLGIVGRNGAGKSTLLKLLSRITRPTTGEALVDGRVGSLLEVGTGFHPELTGRDNVFLNGSILGMDRAYIRRRFDEIVEFAGVERFVDTPVKRYSSGMYLRLAFAVAAHLEPEVLVVDEVLAVGDAEFQKKCLDKMGEVAGEGRTVLFVSHNMGAVRGLCGSAILLSSGRKVMHATAAEVVQGYLGSGAAEGASRSWEGDDAPGDHTARLRAVRVCQPHGAPVERVDMQRPFSVEVEYEAHERFQELNVALVLLDEQGDPVLHSTHSLGGAELTSTAPGRYVTAAEFPAHALNAGHYWLQVHADEPFRRMVWSADRVLRFEVELTCPRVARYPAGSYHGPMGPGLVQWSRRASPVAP